MAKTSKLLIQFIVAGLIIFFLVIPAMAQEVAVPDSANLVPVVVEDVTPEDLGVTEPTLLPDSPFYFLKEWGRQIRLGFTQDETKKTELLQRFANQRLVDLHRAIQKNPEVIHKVQKTIDKLDIDLNKLKERIMELQEKNDTKTDKVIEKFSDSIVKQDDLLNRITLRIRENQDNVQALRERSQNRLTEVLDQLDPEKVNSIVEEFVPHLRSLQSIEVLREVEEKVSNINAKNAVRRARLKQLDKVGEKLTPEAIKAFLEEVVTEEQIESHEETLDEIIEEGIEDPAQVQAIERIREKVRNQREQAEE